MKLEINALFPVEWGKEYYTIESHQKNIFAPCNACDNTGKVTIKGEEYRCPRCNGNWREKEVISKEIIYKLQRRVLSSIKFSFSDSDSSGEAELRFTIPGDLRSSSDFVVRGRALSTMSKMIDVTQYKKESRILYDDHKAALAEVKRLNAESKKATETDDE